MGAPLNGVPVRFARMLDVVPDPFLRHG